MLVENHNISVDHETIRKWLREQAITTEIRKKRPHRRKRQRRICYGELLQFDGSYHDWFVWRTPWRRSRSWVLFTKLCRRFNGQGTKSIFLNDDALKKCFTQHTEISLKNGLLCQYKIGLSLYLIYLLFLTRDLKMFFNIKPHLYK